MAVLSEQQKNRGPWGLRFCCFQHAFHHDLTRSDHLHRTAAVNLIEGSSHQAIAFLDRLTYGSGANSNREKSHAEWLTAVRKMRRHR